MSYPETTRKLTILTSPSKIIITIVSSLQAHIISDIQTCQTRWWHFIDGQYDKVLSPEDRKKVFFAKEIEWPVWYSQVTISLVKKVMETITSTHHSHTDRVEPLHKAANEEDLLSLFNQPTDLMSPNSDWLATEDAVIINEVFNRRFHCGIPHHNSTTHYNSTVQH